MSENIKRLAQRAMLTFAALLLGTGGAIFTMLASPSQALAYGQVTSRSIQMSSAIPSNANTSYAVAFTPASGTPIQAMAVDFCSNDPLIGDSCTAPTGFSVGTPTVTGVTVTGQTGGGTWAAANVNTNRTLTLSNATAQGGTLTAVSFTLTTATNPSTACTTNAAACTFYARIFTFTSTANLSTFTGTANGSYSGAAIQDAGGVALATTSTINITAKVQEQLTFCTSGGTITACSTTSTPNVSLGHGSPTAILDASAVDIGLAYTQLSTNAQGGAIIRMKASNSCSSSTNNGGLSSNGGALCSIPGKGSSAGTIVNGTAAFGMCVNKGTNTTVDANYTDSANSCPTGAYNATSTFGMDGTGLISTYGDQVFSTTGAVSAENNTLVFAATASNTTPAGIYQANESLIATGTF